MTRQEKFSNILSKMETLFEKKDTAYGASYSKNFKRMGLTYPLSRMYEKLDRLMTLKDGQEDNGESIEDNLLDIANIAVLALIELDNKEEETTEKPLFDQVIEKISKIDIDKITIENYDKYVILAVLEYRKMSSDFVIKNDLKLIVQAMIFIDDYRDYFTDEIYIQLIAYVKQVEETANKKLIDYRLGGK